MIRPLAAVLLFAALIPAQSPDKPTQVDQIFSAFNTHTPGCAVGVAQNGIVVLQAGYGMADLERNVPITPDSIFESGSVAKQFTAAAVMLLAQQGKISLDDPLRKYLPELPDYGAPLTIRHVLSHVSGLREWRPLAHFKGLPEGLYVYSNNDILQLAAQQHMLNFTPGAAYSYTNTGFNILPILIERVLGGGHTFQAFTSTNIFTPLGMSHSRWRDDFRTIVPNRALAYSHPEGESAWTQDTPIENIIGAGGLLTTVGDLLLWNENFTHAKVGGPDFVKAQQIPATLSGGRQLDYAAGLTINTVTGLREVSHSGATGGYRTWLGRYPEKAVSVAVLCNSASANPVRLGRETAGLWTGASPAITTISGAAADPARLQGLAGMYRNLRDNTVIRIKWHDGKLTADPANTELVPLGHARFRLGAGDSSMAFEDAPPRLRLISTNAEVLYQRVEPAHPTPADLAALAGEYQSHETETTLKLEPGGKPGEMTYRVASNPPVTLRPTFQDAFETPSGDSIYFVRDTSGKIIALNAGNDRVWNLRFTRIR